MWTFWKGTQTILLGYPRILRLPWWQQDYPIFWLVQHIQLVTLDPDQSLQGWPLILGASIFGSPTLVILGLIFTSAELQNSSRTQRKLGVLSIFQSLVQKISRWVPKSGGIPKQSPLLTIWLLVLSLGLEFGQVAIRPMLWTNYYPLQLEDRAPFPVWEGTCFECLLLAVNGMKMFSEGSDGAYQATFRSCLRKRRSLQPIIYGSFAGYHTTQPWRLLLIQKRKYS